MAATRSFAPDPHRETTRRASVKGTSRGCTRFRSRIMTAPASGVGIDGMKTVYRLSCPGADRDADEEADQEDEEQGQDRLGRKRVREEQGDGPHQTHDGFHPLQKQQDGEVDRNDDEQAGEQRARGPPVRRESPSTAVRQGP